MSDDPVIDGRRREDLRRHAEAIAPYYIDSWNPESDDVGTAMLSLFADLAEDVVERLDRVPEKHRIGFFDTLGFTRHPPQSAKLPLTFAVADDIDENVTIPATTRAIADATDTRPEQTFQLPAGGGFEATPASVDVAYSVDPVGDRIFDARAAVVDHEAVVLFGGEDAQQHELYLGHGDGLRVNAGATIGVSVETDASIDVFKDRIDWTYYGEAEISGETVVGWHPFDGRMAGESPGDTVRFDLQLPANGTLIETAVDGIETHWIRGRLPPRVPPTSPFDLTIGSVAVGPVPEPEGSPLDAMRYNDVPLPVEIDGDGVLPFGETPQRLDTFYLAADEAFSKHGERVELRFETPDRGDTAGDRDGNDIAVDGDAGAGTESSSPRLSWEYWNGTSWTRIPGLTDATNRLRTDGTVTFDVPPSIAPTAVAGEENHWIRVRLVGGNYGTQVFTETNGTWTQLTTGTPPGFDVVRVSFPQPPLVRPEHIRTSNNLAYDENNARGDSGQFRPFSGLPDTSQTIYLGFDAPLRDGPINLLFALADTEYPAEFNPRVRWEYCSDPSTDEWDRLDVDDGTESLTRRGIVSLVFEAETTAFDRFGRHRHWIRGRVTGDEFIPEPVTETDQASIVISDVYPVRELVVITNRSGSPVDLSGYRIDFEYTQPAAQVRAFPEGTTLSAGESLVLASGTKSSGPADLQFDYRRHVMNRGDPDVIALLTSDDEVITSQTYRRRAETAPVRPGSILGDRLADRQDGARQHSTSPSVDSRTDASQPGERPTERQPECPPACVERLTTVPPTGRPSRTAPRLHGLYPNTGWTYNVRSIDAEIVGSSDGSRAQEFDVSSPPVIDGDVWVDELAALSEGDRRDLQGETAVETERVTGPGDEVEAFWVRWRRVDDFLESNATDRHYVLDSATGEITFGDGISGRIPARGRDNVRMSYRTGGGAAGNVGAGTVTDLSSSIPFVDEVTNPVPGDGGADAESMDGVLSRAPQELRDRDRAVTEADVERIVSASSRKLARTKCISSMDENGDQTPGWVTILIVPREQQRRPVPSTETKQRVRESMRERAPATLFEPNRLVVRGPSYVEVTVEATLATSGVESVSTLESRTTGALETYLHPLGGQSDGQGWAFGAVPCRSDIYALLEGIDGVDHVDDLSVTLAGSETVVSLTEGQPTPTVAPDTLVFSGTHEIVARGGR